MAPQPARAGQCRGCLGWGNLAQPPYCSPCHQWRSKKANQPGPCRRCRFPALITPEELCRACILAITEFDAAWYFAPDDRGRCVQLPLIIPGLPLRPARPIGSCRLRSDGRYHSPDWARRQQPAAVFDDQRVCPPAMPGQLMLWRSSRSLTSRHAALIRDRHLDGYPGMRKELSALAAGHGYTKGWAQQADAMIRLALAIRDADGDSMIRPAALADLPRYRDTVGEVARRAGLLDTRPPEDLPHRPQFGPAARHSEPQGCLRCLNWGIGPVCCDCARWAAGPEGTCLGCGRTGVRLRGSRCRTCADQAWSSGPEAAGSEWVQMCFHGSWSRRHRPEAHPEPRAMSTGGEGDVSGHLLWPGQECLAEARRDWRPAFGMARLPALAPAAAALLADFEDQALRQQWTTSTRTSTTRAMRVLLSWLGASALIPEADVRALRSARSGVKIRRLLSFLAGRGLLKPASDSRLPPMELAVACRIGQMPGPMAAELRRWVTVMRGQGRCEHRAASFRTIYNYLGYALPVLGSWQQYVTSLREITRDDVLAAVSALKGEDAHHLIVALRSIFRALKQERMVFANPCAGISVTRSEALPTALPSDRLAGLIDRAGSPLARLAVVLVSVHAVQPGELRRLTMADLDLPRARITIRGDAGRRILYLDELTLRCLDAWLRERHFRWPRTPNPHLLISQQTTADTTPVGSRFIAGCFAPTGITAMRLRQDRILDEARQTADPVRLMRLFGVSDTTAMKYVHTAHPDRQSVPRR